MKNKSVKYLDDALVISIPTNCPQAVHALLMQGLLTSLRQNITTDDRLKDDEDGLLALAALLKVLMPSETSLLKNI